MLQHIVSHGVDLDAADGHQVRPLHLAAINNHCPVVKFLVDKGANVTRPDVDGDLPAHWAATKGQLQVIIGREWDYLSSTAPPSCPCSSCCVSSWWALSERVAPFQWRDVPLPTQQPLATPSAAGQLAALGGRCRQSADQWRRQLRQPQHQVQHTLQSV